MGIADLFDILREHCPEEMVEINLKELAGCKVAIDISIFLNKFVKTSGPEAWLSQFIILLCTLKKSGIRPICIFDGPNAPIEKREEREQRRAEAEKAKQKIAVGKDILKRLKEFKKEQSEDEQREIPEDLLEEVKNYIEVKKGKKKLDVTDYADVIDVIQSLQSCIAKRELQAQPILPIYAEKAKELTAIMGFPYFQADGEAEALCASMCYYNHVDAVLTEDSDVLAYGSPFFLCKLELRTGNLIAICYERVLEALGLVEDEFRDLCILLGCDYNSRIKGYPPDGKKRKKPIAIGMKHAFTMIQEYRRLEEVEKYVEDISPLKYRRCRELFQPPVDFEISVPYSSPIDEKKLAKFIGDNKVPIRVEYVLESWKSTPLKERK